MLNFVSRESLIGKKTLLPTSGSIPSAYIGIDPTASSLHIGNFLSLMSLFHFQACGFRPIILFGGATGLIGDPSGKNSDREQLSPEEVEANISCFQSNLSVLLNNMYSEENTKEYFSHLEKTPEELASDIRFVNNVEFYQKMSVIEFIRDIGIKFRMNTLLSRDSVKNRLGTGDENSTSEGMTFTEFSYQLFQGYDFAQLNQKYNCTFQLGGSDQWGNIASGIEYIRKTTGKEAFGATVNLLTDSKGEKLGKSAGNALMLDSRVNSPFNFYQFFINTQDDVVEKLLKNLTFMSNEKVEEIIKDHQIKAFKQDSDGNVEDERYAHKILAKTVTKMIHGEEAMKAIDATNAFFHRDIKNINKWSLEKLENHFISVEKHQISLDDLSSFSTIASAIFGQSKTQIRRLIRQGGVQINSTKITADRHIEKSELLHGKYILIKLGKKNHCLCMVQ
ncbi:unnamed protein product [Moneuplotes crassus]|uniref:Tyrosine--tRNA ligase n=1 Tax=Euplotes crassus TaxID=5936 RepID=A0AAD1X8X3_EUPCR|nr:unnamed protein product [Moneuplotes crassus]